MKGQHKTLANEMGAGVGWLLAGPITQSQWVMEGCQELDNYNKDAEEVNSSNSMDKSVIIRIIVMQTMVADDMAKD